MLFLRLLVERISTAEIRDILQNNWDKGRRLEKGKQNNRAPVLQSSWKQKVVGFQWKLIFLFKKNLGFYLWLQSSSIKVKKPLRGDKVFLTTRSQTFLIFILLSSGRWKFLWTLYPRSSFKHGTLLKEIKEESDRCCI